MGVIVAIVGSSEASRAAIVAALDAAPPDWTLQLHREPPEGAVVVCDPAAAWTRDAIVFDGEGDLIERISERLARTGRTVLVSGPSGGLGVTSVALHLAAAFATRGHKTGVVDLDPQRGARARLGLDPAAGPDAPVPVVGGFHLLPPCGRTSTYERVVIDVPTASIAEPCAPDAGVLVCCPTPRGARRAGEILERHPDIDWHVVLNRLGPGGETTRTQLERMIGRPVMELPCCAALRDAEDEGRLVRRGWTRWSRGIERLRARLDV